MEGVDGDFDKLQGRGPCCLSGAHPRDPGDASLELCGTLLLTGSLTAERDCSLMRRALCTVTSWLGAPKPTNLRHPRGPPPAIPKNDHTRETRTVLPGACSPFCLASPPVPEHCAEVTGIALRGIALIEQR